MNPTLKAAFDQSMAEARVLLRAGRLAEAERELERAHILGQRFVLPHVRSHWSLLMLEYKRRRYGAILGQLVRIVLGALGSAVGVVPEGNPGTSNVNMFQRRDISPALRNLLER